MFSLANLYNKNGLIIHIEYKERYLDFDISTIISKRNKDDLNPENQFTLLNAYVDYRGDKFKKELMDLYIESENTLIAIINRKDINPLPYSIVHPILDLMDYDKVLDFVTNVYKIVPPESLKTEFNKIIESDGDGSRAQTYLKQDYLELAALVVCLKSVLGPIGHFSYLKHNLINGLNKEYILFNFITTHKIYEIPAMQKLYAFVDKLVEQSFKSSDIANIRTIEKRIPKDEMPLYILASAVFVRIVISSIIHDRDGDNVITKMHTYITNKLKIKKDLTSSIRDKQALTNSEDMNDKDSIIESYRMSAISPGWIVELNWVTSDVLSIVKQLPIEINMDILKDMLIVNKTFLESSITKEQLCILGYVFKDVIDPRALKYIANENIVILLSIAFAYLWELGNKYMAILLCSIAVIEKEDVMTINTSVNRSRLTKEIKDELMELYPYTRVINSSNSVNVVEETIGMLSIAIYDTKWLPIVNDKYIDEVFDNRSLSKVVPADLKIKLAELIINLEKARK